MDDTRLLDSLLAGDVPGVESSLPGDAVNTLQLSLFVPQYNASGGSVECTALWIAAYKGHEPVVELLLAAGADINANNNVCHTTALHAAALAGSLPIMQLLVGHGGDLTAVTDNLSTVFEDACCGGSLPLVTWLATQPGVSLTTAKTDGGTPLHTACFEGHLDVAQWLVVDGGCNATAQDNSGLTPLHTAAGRGHLDVCRWLVEDMGLDPDQRDHRGMSASQWSVLAGNHDVAAYLLSRGGAVMGDPLSMLLALAAMSGVQPQNTFLQACEEGDLDAARAAAGAGADVTATKGMLRSTALHLASAGGHLPVVQWLVEDGLLDVEVREADGATPLYKAALTGHLRVVEWLVANGGDPSACLANRWLPFHAAAWRGHLDVVKYLVGATGVDVSEPTASATTALHVAASKGHLDVCKWLAAAGGAVDAGDDDGATPLHQAAKGGHVDVVQFLVDDCHAAVGTKQSDGATPLYGAALVGHVATLEFLLRSGADAAACLESGASALHAAAGNGNQEAVLCLLRHGCPTAAADDLGLTPLHVAAAGDHRAVVVALVEDGGADTAATDTKGSTPLMLAAMTGSFDAADWLVLHTHADATTPNSLGLAPFHAAVAAGHLRVAQLLQSSTDTPVSAPAPSGMIPFLLAAQGGHIDVCRWLLKQGADAAAASPEGTTAVHAAASSGCTGLLQWLTGDDLRLAVDVRDAEGATPLYSAALHGRLPAAQWLLASGVDVYTALASGWTSLHAAASRGHLDVVKWLVGGAGLPVDGLTRDGSSALHVAASGGHLPMCKWLVEHGGLNPATMNSTGLPPAETAAQHDHMDVATWLRSRAAVDDEAHLVATHPLQVACRDGDLEAVRALLPGHAGALPGGQSPLCVAAANGRLDVVTWLATEGGEDVNTAGSGGMTPLMAACQFGHLDVAQWCLWEARARADACDELGGDALCKACHSGHLHVVQWLVQDADASTSHTVSNGWTPLHIAAWRGHTEVAQWLLEHDGTAANTATPDGRTPVHMAAAGGNTPMLRLLHDRGLPMDSPDAGGATPLHAAAMSGSFPAVQFLVQEAGADSNATADGASPAVTALVTGHMDVAMWLTGASRPDVDDSFDVEEARMVPLLLACMSGDLPAVQRFVAKETDEHKQRALRTAAFGGHLSVVQWLVEAGVDPHGAEDKGADALYEACLGGKLEVAQWLVDECHMSPAHGLTNGHSNLHAASWKGHGDVCRWLLDTHGVDVNQRTDEGFTPLWVTCAVGDTATAQVLVDRGADVSATSSDGLPCIVISAGEGHADMVRFLVRHGADASQRRPEDGCSALHAASSRGNLDMVKCLVRDAHIDVNIAGDGGTSPLGLACRRGHLEVAQWLFAAGAELSTGTIGSSALMEACIAGHVDIVRWLVNDAGADLSVAFEGATAAHAAAKCGRADVLEFLWGKGADFEVVNASSGTPLWVACAEGELAAMQFLVRVAGVAVNAAGVHGITPLGAACVCGRLEAVQWMLEEGGADVTIADEDGRVPVSMALGLDDLSVFQWLVVQAKVPVTGIREMDVLMLAVMKKLSNVVVPAMLGAPLFFGIPALPDSPLRDFMSGRPAPDPTPSPLWAACAEGALDTVRYMLDDVRPTLHGDDDLKAATWAYIVNIRDEAGRTPLMAAIRGGHTAVVAALLNDAAVDVDAKDNGNDSAYDFALRNQRLDLMLMVAGRGRGSVPCRVARLVLVGRQRGGKTSLLKALVHAYNPDLRAVHATATRFKTPLKGVSPLDRTVGCDLRSIKVDTGDELGKLELRVWDMAGQAAYYGSHALFVGAGCLYFLVFDLCNTRPERDQFLETWVEMVASSARGCPVVIVGTHAEKVPGGAPAVRTRMDSARQVVDRARQRIAAARSAVGNVYDVSANGSLDAGAEEATDGGGLDAGAEETKDGDGVGAEETTDGDGLDAGAVETKDGDGLDAGAEETTDGDGLDAGAEETTDGDGLDAGAEETTDSDGLDAGAEETEDGDADAVMVVHSAHAVDCLTGTGVFDLLQTIQEVLANPRWFKHLHVGVTPAFDTLREALSAETLQESTLVSLPSAGLSGADVRNLWHKRCLNWQEFVQLAAALGYTGTDDDVWRCARTLSELGVVFVTGSRLDVDTTMVVLDTRFTVDMFRRITAVGMQRGDGEETEPGPQFCHVCDAPGSVFTRLRMCGQCKRLFCKLHAPHKALVWGGDATPDASIVSVSDSLTSRHVCEDCLKDLERPWRVGRRGEGSTQLARRYQAADMDQDLRRLKTGGILTWRLLTARLWFDFPAAYHPDMLRVLHCLDFVCAEPGAAFVVPPPAEAATRLSFETESRCQEPGCGRAFSKVLWPRRHHCRVCFGSRCDAHSDRRLRVAGGARRVCDGCMDTVNAPPDVEVARFLVPTMLLRSGGGAAPAPPIPVPPPAGQSVIVCLVYPLSMLPAGMWDRLAAELVELPAAVVDCLPYVRDGADPAAPYDCGFRLTKTVADPVAGREAVHVAMHRSSITLTASYTGTPPEFDRNAAREWTVTREVRQRLLDTMKHWQGLSSRELVACAGCSGKHTWPIEAASVLASLPALLGGAAVASVLCDHGKTLQRMTPRKLLAPALRMPLESVASVAAMVVSVRVGHLSGWDEWRMFEGEGREAIPLHRTHCRRYVLDFPLADVAQALEVAEAWMEPLWAALRQMAQLPQADGWGPCRQGVCATLLQCAVAEEAGFERVAVIHTPQDAGAATLDVLGWHVLHTEGSPTPRHLHHAVCDAIGAIPGAQASLLCPQCVAGGDVQSGSCLDINAGAGMDVWCESADHCTRLDGDVTGADDGASEDLLMCREYGAILSVPYWSWENGVACGPHMSLHVVRAGTTEFQLVKNRFISTMPDGTRLVRVQRLHNFAVRQQFTRLWEEWHGLADGRVSGEELLFHGTSGKNPAVILAGNNTGLDMRFGKTPLTQRIFHDAIVRLVPRLGDSLGRGLYFARRAEFCDAGGYAYATGDENDGRPLKQLLLVRVLCGHVMDVGADKDHTIVVPPEGCDSVQGGPWRNINTPATAESEVVAVYNHRQTYPQYVLTYTSP